MTLRYLYIFLDESGNLDFSRNGTRYFSLTSITKERPFPSAEDLLELKYDLVEKGLNIEYFHASEDAQETRNHVFSIIQAGLHGIRVDALIVEKGFVEPSRRNEEKFYPEMLGLLLRHVLEEECLEQFSEVIVFTDRIPVQRKRSAVEKATKMALASLLPKEAKYRVLHHESKSNLELQIADYLNWAIYRKWDRRNLRSYNLIQEAIREEILYKPGGGSEMG